MQEIRETMERILQHFVDAARVDESLARFAADSEDVTLHFILKDLRLALHLGFSA